MSHVFDLRSLSYFVAVAEELNFRRAAEKIFISQPALSYQIMQLEKNLNLQLLERDPRGVSLTEAGRHLLVGARHLLAEAALLQRRLEQLASDVPQRLIMGLVDYVFLPRLPSVIRGLKTEFPGIKLETIDLPFTEQLDALLAGRVDVATMRMPIDHPDLIHRLLVEGHWTVVLPTSHPLARRKNIELKLLAGESLIFFSQRINPPLFEWMLEQCREAGFEADVVYETAQSRLGPDLVSQGVGLWLAGSYLYADLPKGVVARPLTGFENQMALGLVWHRQNNSKARQALVELLTGPLPEPR